MSVKRASLQPSLPGILAFLALAGVFLLYLFTAYRVIAWWDTPVYALAAYSLGVAHPPGSLLLTLIGWLVTRISGPPDLVLNLLAGLIGVCTLGLLWLSAVSVLRQTDKEPPNNSSIPAVTGLLIAAGILLLGGSESLWQFSTKFTPYILTACFTALILWALIRWSDALDTPSQFRWLIVAGVLVGLDISVHRTNLLLIPGILFWILMHRASFLLKMKTWGALIFGGLIGGLVHLLIIPIASADPALNFADPATFGRFWDYIALTQYGGGFLINLFPRTAPLWSYQVTDYLNVFAANFFPIDGPLGWFGILPGLFGIAGIGILWTRSRPLALGSLGLFICLSLVAVLYFNLPENFIRPIARHYLPSFIIFGFWILLGLGYSGQIFSQINRRTVALSGVGLLVFAGILSLLFRNYPERDMTGHRFAEDFASNMLTGLPENAILITNGDVDTYPLWYLQHAEGFREDVTVCNIYLLNTPWFVRQLIRRDPEFPLTMTPEAINQLRIIPWSDSTVTVPGDPRPDRYGFSDTTAMPEEIPLNVTATQSDHGLLVHDQVFLDLVRKNRWERPICMSVGMSSPALAYMHPYRRLEGLHWRIVPLKSPEPALHTLHANLISRYRYEGYDDPKVPVDNMTRWAGQNYYSLFLELVSAIQERGGAGEISGILEFVKSAIPPDRVDLPESIRTRLDSLEQMEVNTL